MARVRAVPSVRVRINRAADGTGDANNGSGFGGPPVQAFASHIFLLPRWRPRSTPFIRPAPGPHDAVQMQYKPLTVLLQ
jgi:hypothetical protein